MALSERIKEHLDRYYISQNVTLGTAGTIAHIPCPAGAAVMRATTVLDGAIATGNAVLTFELATVTLKDNAATPVTVSLTILTAASAAGQVDSVTFQTGNIALTAADGDVIGGGSVLEVIDAGASGAGTATIVIEFQP